MLDKLSVAFLIRLSIFIYINYMYYFTTCYYYNIYVLMKINKKNKKYNFPYVNELN